MLDQNTEPDAEWSKHDFNRFHSPAGQAVAIKRIPRLRKRLDNLAVGKVEQTEYSLLVPSPLESKYRLDRLHKGKISFHQGGMLFSPVCQPSKRLQDRVRIIFLRIDRESQMFLRQRQPRLPRGEPAI